MIRITKTERHPTKVTLLVAGKVCKECVDILETEHQSQLRDGMEVVLDLTDVTFVDARGIDLLRTVSAQGTEIINASPFIGYLLQESRSEGS